MTRRLWPAAVAVIASLILAGCSGIPQSGAPRIGQPVQGAEDPEVQFIADSPQAGASQEDILRGFIDAASSPREDYATAREFLAPKIRSKSPKGSNSPKCARFAAMRW